jgi:hypothetical protein
VFDAVGLFLILVFGWGTVDYVNIGASKKADRDAPICHVIKGLHRLVMLKHH